MKKNGKLFHDVILIECVRKRQSTSGLDAEYQNWQGGDPGIIITQ
jgi:hypothetical protein